MIEHLGNPNIFNFTTDCNPRQNGGIDTYVEEKTTLNRLETPMKLDPLTASFEDIRNHALLRQRLAPKTVRNHLKYLRFMELHPVPVDLRSPSLENFLRHMDYREQMEHCGNGALKHENEAYRMYLRAIGKNPADYYYKPPPRNQRMTPIPYPDQVHKMIHQEYSKDSYTNALIRYILCHNHIIGWRPPSEPAIIKVSDVDLDHETIVVTMPKLHNRSHSVSIGEICNKRDVPSMRNWIDVWRPRVENQYSQDYLYLTPQGKPFTNDGLRHFLYTYARPRIREVFPEYYNYTSRHWCAIARLIRTKIESKKYDEYEVMEYLGHTKIDTTMTYIQRAKFYYEQTGYDWIKHVLNNVSPKKARSSKFPSVETNAVRRTRHDKTGENRNNLNTFSWQVELEAGVSDLSLSFSFFVCVVSVTGYGGLAARDRLCSLPFISASPLTSSTHALMNDGIGGDTKWELPYAFVGKIVTLPATPDIIQDSFMVYDWTTASLFEEKLCRLFLFSSGLVRTETSEVRV